MSSFTEKINKLKQISIFKTIKFNLHYFGWGGVFLPCVLVTHNVVLRNLHGEVELRKTTFGVVKIGFYMVGIEDAKYNRTIWNNTGKVVFEGRANIGSGTKISNSGVLSLGDNFVVASNSKFVCRKGISFGDNVLVSWECLFMDTDFHEVFSGAISNKQDNPDREIMVDSDVWIGCRALVLKGTHIGHGNVVAAGAIFHGDYGITQSIVSGNRILKKDIRWKA